MIKEIHINTQNRYELVDIGERVKEAIRESETREGIALIFVPHSTAAVILTENEPGLKKDWISFLKRLVSGINFSHNKIDNNADSHILSGLLGQGKALAVEKGELVKGTWQQIFLVELDGPRKRKVIIKIVSS